MGNNRTEHKKRQRQKRSESGLPKRNNSLIGKMYDRLASCGKFNVKVVSEQ